MPTTTAQQNILQTLALDGLPDETQMELLSQMTESVLKRMAIEVLQTLSEEDQKTLLEMQAENPDLEKIEEFIQSRTADFQKLKERVVKEFTEEMRETVAMLREGVAKAA